MAEWGPFQVQFASLQGLFHLEHGMNNQDGLALVRGEDLLVCAVTDGCSSTVASEVGAKLGARWLATWIPQFLRFERTEAGLRSAVKKGFTEFLSKLSRDLSPTDDDVARVVQDHLLFTFITAVVDSERFLVFGLGDGVVRINDQLQVLDAGPDGAPPYVAYELVRDHLLTDPGSLEPVLLWDGPTREVKDWMIATDGLVPLTPGKSVPDEKGLDKLFLDPRFVAEKDLLERHLVELHLDGHLGDDATAILGRRRG